MRCRVAFALLLVASGVAGCDDLRTDGEAFGLNLDDFDGLPGAPPFLVVDGTRLCEESHRCGPCEGDAPICMDAAVSVDGAAADADGCYTALIGAPLTYTFTPEGCTEATPAESLTVEAIAADAVVARLEPPLTTAEALADDDGWVIATQGAPPPAVVDFTPLQLLADAPVELQLHLRAATGGRRVGFNQSAGVFALQALAGELPGVVEDGSARTITASAGARAAASFTLAGVERPLAEVVGVDADAPAAIELTAFFLDAPEGQQPIQIEAQVVDAAGVPVVGVPIGWRVVDGDLVVDPGDVAGSTASLSECIPRRPKATRSGVVEAAYGDLRATLALSWRGYEGDDPYNVGPCEGGCGCRSGAGDPAALAWLALGLGLLRRRRSAG